MYYGEFCYSSVALDLASQLEPPQLTTKPSSGLLPIPLRSAGLWTLNSALWFGIRSLEFGIFKMVGYPSGQRGQTVNLLANAFDGSNPSPTTTFHFC